MSNLIKRIDPWFLTLIGVMVVWWLVAGGVQTPSSQINVLQNSSDPELWLDALGSGDRIIRNYARENLPDALPPESLESIAVQAVEDPDPDTRIAGLWILAHADIEGGGEIAARFLHDENKELIEAALDVLANDPVPEVHDRLVELTDDPEDDIQAASLRALVSYGDSDDLPVFISFLGKSNVSLIHAGRDGIIAIAPHTPGTITALMGTAYGSDLHAAREALGLIGEIGDTEILDGLFSFLEYGPVGLTSDAADAIGKIGGEAAGLSALDLYRTSTGRIRKQTARVLETIEVKEAQDDLWAVVQDRSEEFWLRYYSLEALSTCADESLVPEIIKYIENEEPDDRLVGIGIEAIGGIGGDDVISVYDAIIAGEIDFGLNRSGGEAALISVIKGLGRMDSDESRTRLRSIAESAEPDNFEILIELAKAFTKIGTREDVEILRELGKGKSIMQTPVDNAIAAIEERYPGEAE